MNYNKVTTRKYFLNEEYFKEINTYDKAYFLGLFYSDGNNYSPTGTASIGLQEEDGYILELLSKYISNFQIPIKLQKRDIGKNQRYIKICSRVLSTDLYRQGVVDRKSLILKFPTEKQVPKYLMHHFIRGYFDGDGCISLYTKKDYNRNPDAYFTLSGSNDFLKGCQKVFEEELSIKAGKLIKNKNIYNLTHGGNAICLKIRDFLYKDCEDLFLTRKKEKFDMVNIFIPKKVTEKCIFCNKIATAKDMCKKHYDASRHYKTKKNMELEEFKKFFKQKQIVDYINNK